MAALRIGYVVTHLSKGRLGYGVVFTAEDELDAVTNLRCYLVGGEDSLIDMSQGDGSLFRKTEHTASWPPPSIPT